jgi:hypothetical protein
LRQALLGGPDPGFAGALAIYSTGKYALREDGVTKRAM